MFPSFHFPKQPAAVRLIATLAVGACAAWLAAAPAAVSAAVVVFDGFGDADLDNNGVHCEPADVDVSDGGDSSIGPYTAVGNGGDPALFPHDTMVPEVDAVEQPDDAGIKWFSISGFSGTGQTGPPRMSIHIIDDTAENLPETNPAIGYNHTLAGGNRVAAAIDSGLALAVESKGRPNQFAGFFGDRIALGPDVGDTVEVSFDFRLWFCAASFNSSQGINHIPAIGELRFGLYQDTDNQLGSANADAGRRSPDAASTPVPAIWGAENGNFRGDVGDVNAAGAQGDRGWYVRLPIDDPEVIAFDKLPGGASARINEELNTGSATDRRILNGAADLVARPDPLLPQFVNLDVDRVYRISLSLSRFDDPATTGDAGDSVYAEVTVRDLAADHEWSFGGYEPVADGGVQSDSWDYFTMGSAAQTDSDEMDWLIDNFTVESREGGASIDGADFNDDGQVDGADFLIWQRGFLQSPATRSSGDANNSGAVDEADLALWKLQFPQATANASSAAPEPTGGTLGLAAMVAAAGAARRQRRSGPTRTA